MIRLFPLRPVEIVDVSFQLIRKKFGSSFFIALAVTLPLQFLAWVFEISVLDQGPNDNLTGRTILLIFIIHFCSIGVSLCTVSNILSKRTTKIYCDDIFNNLYQPQKSKSRIPVAIYHIGLQIIFLTVLLLTRFIAGRFLIDSQANAIGFLALFALAIPWIILTLRLGFAVPISVFEGGNFRAVLKRSRQINRIHFFKLVGVYTLSILLILILIMPTLSAIQMIISKNLIKSDVADWAFFNFIVSIIISGMSVVYSFILTVTYFDARIDREGFDIAVAIQQLEEEENNGELLRSLSR
ncbi:MAG: hypothetical protein U0R17_04560 [Acidimicrobiia bacterium]